MTETTNGPAARCDEERLWRRHMEMARLGATPRGGVKRLALTALDNEARALLARWAGERGFAVFLDPVGNLFIRREGLRRDAAPVLSGSHTDTQPSGGKFDGIYGVLAAFEALEAIEEAGIATSRAIEAVVWTAEEGGARFPTGTLGSSVFAGKIGLADALAQADDAGVTVEEAMRATREALPGVAAREVGFPIAAFVEAHIEQGPILEAEGRTIGVVSAIQGARRFRVEVTGDDAHAGTTPRRNRKDALSAAVKMVAALEEVFTDPEDVVRFTVGRFRVSPDAPAVVPGHVWFTIDFRHPEEAVLERLGNRVKPVCEAQAGPCRVDVIETSRSAPVPFTTDVPQIIQRASDRLGFSSMSMISGAGHDAMQVALVAPAGMIFVPCERGVSHNETENATQADLAAGARVLAEVLVDLANR